MPNFLVMQPNGKLAAFSTIVDDFTAINMTAEQAVEYCRYRTWGGATVDEARAKVAKAIQLGRERFYESVDTVFVIHGEQRGEQLLRQMRSEPVRSIVEGSEE